MWGQINYRGNYYVVKGHLGKDQGNSGITVRVNAGILFDMGRLQEYITSVTTIVGFYLKMKQKSMKIIRDIVAEEINQAGVQVSNQHPHKTLYNDNAMHSPFDKYLVVVKWFPM